MSDSTSASGSIPWIDLTVPHAEAVRDFYQAVAGWTYEPVGMGGYDDYSMVSAGTGQAVAGICHAQEANAGLPPQWLIYITVPDLEQSLAECVQRGGEVVMRPGGSHTMALIRDPAGAIAMLMQP